MTPRSGLSLFELLISLALLALLSAGLAAGLNLGAQLYTRTADLSEGSEEIAMRIRLRHWLSEATPPARLTPFPSVFLGAATSLDFTTLAETPFAPEAAALRVRIEFQAAGLNLQIQTLSDAGEVLDLFEGRLATDVKDATFSYFNVAAEPPVWQEIWEDTSRLPDLVRIDVEPGSNPDWPEFTVRPVLR